MDRRAAEVGSLIGWRALFIGGLLLTLPGCPLNDADAPSEAYRSYAAALRHGDAATAWELLSSGTKDALTAKARAISDARGVPPPADGKALAFANTLHETRDIKSTSVAPTGSDRAVVTVVDALDEKQEIQTVRENGQWRVDFTQALATAH